MKPADILDGNRICERVQQMLTRFFHHALKYFPIKMLGCAINVYHAISIAGFLIRKGRRGWLNGRVVNARFCAWRFNCWKGRFLAEIKPGFKVIGQHRVFIYYSYLFFSFRFSFAFTTADFFMIRLYDIDNKGFLFAPITNHFGFPL